MLRRFSSILGVNDVLSRSDHSIKINGSLIDVEVSGDHPGDSPGKDSPDSDNESFHSVQSVSVTSRGPVANGLSIPRCLSTCVKPGTWHETCILHVA